MDINFLEKKEQRTKDDKKKNLESGDKADKKFFNAKEKKAPIFKELEKKRKLFLKDIKAEKGEEFSSKMFFDFGKIKNNIKKYFSISKKKRKDFYKTTAEESEVVFKTEKQEKKTYEHEDKKWEKIDILNTNLIKNELYIDIDWQMNIIYLIIGILISSIILSGTYFSISYINETKNENKVEYAKEIAELKVRIAEADKEIKNIEIFGSKIRLVKDVLDSHVYWNNFFSWLEKNTLPNVYYSSFSGDLGGVYNLYAKTDDYDSLYSQILHFKNNPDVLEVRTESASRTTNEKTGESLVNFGLNIKINPKIFYQ